MRDAVSASLVDALFACVSLVARILTEARDVDRGIRSQNSLALLGPLSDIRTQLAGLVHPGFVSAAGSTGSRTSRATSTGCSSGSRTLANEPGKDRTG